MDKHSVRKEDQPRVGYKDVEEKSYIPNEMDLLKFSEGLIKIWDRSKTGKVGSLLIYAPKVKRQEIHLLMSKISYRLDVYLIVEELKLRD
jgi:hypothetical protein